MMFGAHAFGAFGVEAQERQAQEPHHGWLLHEFTEHDSNPPPLGPISERVDYSSSCVRVILLSV